MAVNPKVEKILRASRLAKRWKFCQEFARDIYRSDLSDDALKAVAASVALAMRGREDEMQQRFEDALLAEEEIT